jgi:hypothetical protein
MKIGILTQPLANNYGGTLQNYALQTVLHKMGHEPITLDYVPKTKWKAYWKSFIKAFLLFPSPYRRSFPKIPYSWKRKEKFEEFTKKHIIKTQKIKNYTPILIDKYHLDAIIVGSDQIWRPKYNRCIEDCFLKFSENANIKKIAYAVSFGVDYWEFTAQQTETCRHLVKQFDAVSVREDSGIRLCQEYLGIEAIQTIDPTLLLEKHDYEELIRDIPIKTSPFLAAYILDMSGDKQDIILKNAKERDLEVKEFTIEKKAELSVYEWIAMFRDASYIVTDSFHGVVFSIIFNKEYQFLGNEIRGNSRLNSLMKLKKTNKIEELKITSMSFLTKYLSS